MSLLNSVLGGLLGGNSNASPMQGILGSLLGGGGQGGGLGGMLGGGQQQSGGLGGALGGLLGGGQQQSGGLGGLLGGGQQPQQMGGLGGLLGRFQQAGMGDVANSWVGTGANQQVSPEQLEQVFGHEQIDQWSQQSNMPKQDLLSQLSQYLPHAVDRMTPNGKLPEGDSPFDKAGVNL